MRKSIVLILILLCSTFTYAIDSFYVDREGWCRGLEIPFTVYNLSEWNDREDILDDDDENFSKLNFKVTIFDGPFDLGDPFFEKEFKNTYMPEFNITFTDEKPYLMEIIATKGNFSKYSETLEIRNCIAVEEKINPKTYNISAAYSNSVELSIKNTTIEDISQINLNKEEISKYNLENGSTIYSLNGPEEFRGEISLEIPYNSSNENEVEVFKLDEQTNEKTPITTYTIEEESVIITTEELGTYGIFQKEDKEEITVITEEPEEVVREKPKEELEESSSTLDIANWIIIGIFIVIVFIFAPKLFTSKTKKEKYHEEKEKENRNQISSSKEAYHKTKEYVQKYKNQYSREAIESALKGTGVSEEIIQLVFSEEY